MNVVSQVLRISNAEAMRWSKDLARKEGIFVGITSGATFAGALRVEQRSSQGIDDSVHAAGYGRAVLEHSALCGYFGRYDRGRAGDCAFHSERLAAARVRSSLAWVSFEARTTRVSDDYSPLTLVT